jgi:hypothetical protein
LVVPLPRRAQTQLLEQQDVASEESQDKAQEKAQEGKDMVFLYLSVKQHAAADTTNYAKSKIPANAQ